MDWSDFARAAPDFAEAGTRLLTRGGPVAIGFLASAHHRVHLAPVCPIFCEPALYLSVGARTPKRHDLERDGRYALHAFLAEHDEEFRIDGRARRCDDQAERARVHAAIRFGAFDRADPIFRLDVERALWGFWENVGRPGTRPVRRTWRATRPT